MSKEELKSKRYILDKPPSVYPLHRKVYPDFQPWNDPQPVSVNSLQKGYSESPVVNNEYLSARNLMNQLFIDDSTYKNLSYYISKSINIKDSNNRISPISQFKPPPRVTLTEQKKEQWLKDLANPSQPLRKLSRTIPHGIRNKNLLDQLTSKSIPIKRAIWFTKCICINELRSLKRKKAASDNSWFSDWTDQIIEYIINVPPRDTTSVNKIAYLTTYITHLMLNEMINTHLFLSSVLRLAVSSSRDNKVLALHLVVSLWWFFVHDPQILPRLAQCLLMICKEMNQWGNVKQVVGPLVRDRIRWLFGYDSGLFILPSDWDSLRIVLNNVLEMDHLAHDLRLQSSLVSQFDLVDYRNISLMVQGNAIHDEFAKHLMLLDNNQFDEYLGEVINTTTLKNLIKWTISPFRNNDPDTLVILPNILLKGRKKGKFKKEFEDHLLDVIFEKFNDAKPDSSSICDTIDLRKLFVFTNELYQVGLFTISGYLRRIVSSGVILEGEVENKQPTTDQMDIESGSPEEKLFLPHKEASTNIIHIKDTTSKNWHLSLLANLPLLSTTRSNLLQKRLPLNKNDTSFNQMKALLSKKILDLFTQNIPLRFRSDEITQLNSLNVGVKFLIVNHIITELKSIGHLKIDSEKIASLYSIFWSFDNLVIFYKEFISLCLGAISNNNTSGSNLSENSGSNTNGMINEVDIDIDSLCFICFLIKVDLELCNSVGLIEKLEKTILRHYREHLDQITYHDFGSLLNTFQSSEEKLDIRHNWKLTNKEILKICNTLGLELEVFDKEMDFESDSIDLVSNLGLLFERLKEGKFPVSEEQIYLDIVKSFKKDDDDDEEDDDDDDDLFNDIEVKTELEYELDLIKLLKMCQSVPTFQTTLNLYLINLDPKFSNSVTFIFKILVHELTTFEEIFSTLNRDLSVHLLFHRPSLNSYIENMKLLKLRKCFMKDNIAILSFMIENNFNKLLNSEYYSKKVQLFKSLTVMNLKLLLEKLPYLASSKAWDETVGMYNLMLNVKFTEKSQLPNILRRIDRFNLPLFQVLIKLVFQKSSYTSMEGNIEHDNYNDENHRECISSVLRNCDYMSVGVFDLFKFLNVDFKKMLLNRFEATFLDAPDLPNIMFENTNLIPLLKDFFKDFLIPTGESIETDADFYRKLKTCLNNLIDISQEMKPTDTGKEEIHDCVYIFLRISIIHKKSLVSHILEELTYQSNLIKNLNRLFSSEIINESHKLKILFYDILLLFRNSLLDSVTISPSPSASESPPTQDNIVSQINQLFKLPEMNNNSVKQLNGMTTCGVDNSDFTLLKKFKTYDENSKETVRYKIKFYDLLEDSNSVQSLNDTPINLSLFGAHVDKQNPP